MENPNDIVAAVIAAVASVRRLEPQALVLDSNLRDLGLDSIGLFLVANQIADIYELEQLEPHEISELFRAATIADLVALVRKMTSQRLQRA